MHGQQDLRCLIYRSIAAPNLSRDMVADIGRVAASLNARGGVTGLLIYNGRNFAQLLEGASSVLDNVMRRISADNRHSGIVVEFDYLITERSFPDWAMQIQMVESDWLVAAPAFDDLFSNSIMPLPASEVRNVVRTISQH